MQKNTAGQKIIVFAFDRTDNTPVTGDAANITANLRKDNGSAVATNDTNPTETEDGFYAFDLTQAETNADTLQGFPASVTADVQVIAVPGVIYTTPVNFGDDVIQTADNDIKISLIPTTAMRGTDSANTVVPPSVAQFNARTLVSADYFIVTDYTAPDNAGITANGVAISALNDISVAQIFAGGDIDGFDLEESQKLILAASAGTLSGAATTTVTITAVDGSKARLTATVDGDGNRSAVIKDATG